MTNDGHEEEEERRKQPIVAISKKEWDLFLREIERRERMIKIQLKKLMRCVRRFRFENLYVNSEEKADVEEEEN